MREFSDELREIRWEIDQVEKRLRGIVGRVDHLEQRMAEATPDAAQAAMVVPVAESAKAALPAEIKIPEEPDRVSPAPPPLPAQAHRTVQPVLHETAKIAVPEPGKKSLINTPVADLFSKVWDRVGPPKGLTPELFITTWLLPRVGMGILAVGVVFLLTLAVQYFQDTWWIKYGRLAGGYGLAFGLMGVSRLVRGGFKNLAPLLFGGGMALVYFVTFAMHFVPFTRVIHSPEPVLLMLAGIVGVWAVYTVWMNSKRLGFITTLMGHGTVLLSAIYVPEPGILSMAGLLVLSVGSAWLLARMRWYSVGALGMVLSYGNYVVLLQQSTATPTVEGILVVLAILTLNHSIFALGELLSPASLRNGQVKTRGRTTYVSFNTGAYLVVGAVLLGGTTQTAAYDYLFYFAVSGVLALYSVGYWWRDVKDVIFNAYFIKACSVFTFGLALYLESGGFVLALALETVVLIAGARWMKRVVSRVASHGTLVLTVLVGVWYFHDLKMPSAFVEQRYLFIQFAMIGSALLVAAGIYAKTNWTASTPKTLPVGDVLQNLLWQLGLVQVTPRAGQQRFLGYQLWPYSYAFAGMGLWTAGVWQCVAQGWPFLVVGALVVSVPGVLLRMRSFTGAAMVAGLTGCAWFIGDYYGAAPGDAYSLGLDLKSILPFSSVLILALIELARITGTQWPQRWPQLRFMVGEREVRWSSAVLLYSIAGLGVAVTLVDYFVVTEWQVVTAIAVATIMTVYALVTGSYAIGAVALGMVGYGCFATHSNDWSDHVNGYLVVMLAIVALGSEGRYLRRFKGLQFHQNMVVAPLLYCVMAASYLWVVLDSGWDTNTEYMLVLVGATVMAICARWLHRHAMAGLSLVMVGLVSLALSSEMVFYTLDSSRDHHLVWATILLCIVFERYPHFFKIPVDLWRNALAAPLTLVSYLYLAERLPDDWLWAAWTILGAALLVYGSVGRLIAHKTLGVLVVVGSGVELVMESLGGNLAVYPMVGAYTAQVLVWIAAERYYTLRKAEKWGYLRMDAVVGAVVGVLLLVLGYSIPGLAKTLTLNWAVGSILLFGVGAVTRQAWYRYAALVILGMALVHVVVVDATRLEGVFRILAYIGLGIVSIGVALGYTKFKDRV